MHYKTSHGDRRDCCLPLWRLCFLVLWHFRSNRDIPCLFCLDSKQKVRNLPKREHYNLYTQMHNSFWRAVGKQNINAVKCFNNKLRHPFLEIKIANIAPPYLYVLLGITLKHPNLIQKEVQNRDEIIAKQKHSNYRRNWLKAEEKKKQIVLSKGTLY